MNRPIPPEVETRQAPPDYPVRLEVSRATENRDQITAAFRIFLAIPHLLLVGGPLTVSISWTWATDSGWVSAVGALGAAAGVSAIISWFAILFTGNHPEGLWQLSAYYLRWRVRALAYAMLLRDEFPPLGEGTYPARLELEAPEGPRDPVTVAFRLILALPHLVIVWVLGMAWMLTTVIAWFTIVLTGQYPPALYDFALSVFQWTIRVEAYMLLLRDEYPPFSLD